METSNLIYAAIKNVLKRELNPYSTPVLENASNLGSAYSGLLGQRAR